MSINIIGQRYGKLIVLESAGYRIEPSGKRENLLNVNVTVEMFL